MLLFVVACRCLSFALTILWRLFVVCCLLLFVVRCLLFVDVLFVV